ncbi:MAG: ion transporter [Sumerlaeia bacterium]
MHDFVYGKKFAHFIIAVIIFNAALIGVEIYVKHWSFGILEWICVWIFTAEIILKLTYAKRKADYFSDPWNWFDVIVVGAAFIPETAGFSTVLRILRVLRVLRLVKAIPEMRLIVNVLMRSLTSMTYIAGLMLIVFYIYAVTGVKLFGATQPEYATLHEAMFTLFRALTLEDWTDIRYDAAPHGNLLISSVYHVSWILLSTFVILNLIVGAILNNYSEVQEIEKTRRRNLDLTDERLLILIEELNTIMKVRAAQSEMKADRAKLPPPHEL